MAKPNGCVDYVIVGAGTAGCTLANRLSEDGAARVLLSEAGGWDRDPWIRIPLGWGKIQLGRLHDWGYFAEPEASLDNRAIECARGKVIGGSSSINAMAHVRGNRGDFDRWSASGLKTWSYAHTLPYFRRQESCERGDSFYRGGCGPLTAHYSRYVDPLVTAYFEAGIAAGYARSEDYNAAAQEGFGLLQSNIRSGRRCSAADAYLRPALRRPNLHMRSFVDGFSCRPVLLRPESSGSVSLRSADPAIPPRIRQNFLATDRERKTLRDGVRVVREIARQAPLAPFIAAEVSPGPGKDSDTQIDAHIRATSSTAHHPLGTSKMGLQSDAMAVVDEELRVFGVDGLRVVDAAVMPDLIGGNINAAVGMIAEKAAAVIRGCPPLPAATAAGS